MSQTFTPRPQIYAVFPSNKIGLFIEDCTNLKKPKIRIALVPTKQGTGEPVEFFMDLAPARVFFADLGLLGHLLDDALTKTVKNQKGNEIPVFDLFAKIGEHGHRSLTCSNMPDGVYLKIVKKNGEKATLPLLGIRRVRYLYRTHLSPQQCGVGSPIPTRWCRGGT